MSVNKYMIPALIAVVMIAACQGENMKVPQVKGSEIRLSADHESRVWSAGETVSIFDGLANLPFTAVDSGDSSTFVSDAALDEQLKNLYALSPYDPTAIRTDYGLELTYPGEQHVLGSGADSSACIAVAYTDVLAEKTHLHFMDLCCWFRFSVKASDQIVRVKLSGRDGEYLAGTVEVTFSDDEPHIAVIAGAGSVSLNSSVPMDGTYMIGVLPSVLQDGLYVVLTNAGGETSERRVIAINDDGVESALVFKRGRINREPLVFDDPFAPVIEVGEECWINCNVDGYFSEDLSADIWM